MIFKMVKTEHANGVVDHGVSLYYDGDSEKQDAVIVYGATYAAAYNLYSDLNEALSNAGLVHTKNKAANDSGANDLRVSARVSELTTRVNLLVSEKAVLEKQVLNFKRSAFVSIAFIVLTTLMNPAIIQWHHV